MHAAWLLLRIGGERGTQVFDTIALGGAVVAGAAACAVAARSSSGRERAGWALLGGAMILWLSAAAAVPHYAAPGGRGPFPWAAELALLASYPLVGAAVLLLAPPARRGTHVRRVLDGLIIAGSLLFSSWALLIGDAVRAAGSGAERIVVLVSPVSDVVIASLAVWAVATAPRAARPARLLLAAGLVAFTATDGAFLWLDLHDAYAIGSPIDAGWLSGCLLVGLAALRRGPADEASEPAAAGTGWAVPYAAFMPAVGVAAFVQMSRGSLEPFLFWNALTVVLLVTARQILTLRENATLARNLDVKVQGRTAELEAVIRHLGEVQQLQDAFLANVSHELRTPVTKMIAAARMLTRFDLGLGEEAREIAAIADRSATRMAVLVEDLLIAAGLGEESPCARSPFNLAAELRGVLKDFSPSGRQVRVRTPQTLVALGDPARFRALVTHLLSNAEKFSPPGSTIQVEASSRDELVDLTVLDEGPGIPPAYREKVFDRFFQIDATSTRAHGGTGLGLYIARQLAESMGARLWVDDSPRGTALRLRLPALVADRVISA